MISGAINACLITSVDYIVTEFDHGLKLDRILRIFLVYNYFTSTAIIGKYASVRNSKTKIVLRLEGSSAIIKVVNSANY